MLELIDYDSLADELLWECSVLHRKYYLDTQRREDAFDLSGPHHPEGNHPIIRPVGAAFIWCHILCNEA